ncbi:MATE family efflux transporter [Sorangium sp. So ce1000]|uniref:MATE family efflux transporter n=1 Tax=Sorangium sp. So ce1000 TaxID=3133325 RepID=UPI003F62F3C8
MSDRDAHKQFILEGDLRSVMWRLSWPAVLAMVLYGLNSFLDAVFVGQLMNERALAGVGIAYPLSQITLGLGSLIGTGAGTALSIYLGADDRGKLHGLLGSVNGLSLLVSLPYSVLACWFAEPLVRMMGGSGEILAYGTAYFQATALGALFWVHGLAVNMTVRGEGKMKTAAWMISIGLLVDVALKPLFIHTFGWGVQGAAWATNAAMFVYSAVGLLYYARGRASFDTAWRTIRVDPSIRRQILSLGMPAMIVAVMGVVQNVVVFGAVSSYGTAHDVAFFAACNRLFLFMMTPLFGLMRALQPVEGISYGARRYGRVRRAFSQFSLAGLVLILPFWLSMMLAPGAVLGSMLPGFDFSAQQLIDFRIYVLALPTLSWVLMALVFFPSVERANIASALALLRQVVFFLPVMWLLPKVAGVRGVFWGSAGIDVALFVLVLLLVGREFRRLDGRGTDADAPLREATAG